MSESGLKKIGVIGIGTMGNGIAQVCAQCGFDTKVLDVNDAALERGMGAIKKSLDRLVAAFEKSAGEKGISPETRNVALGLDFRPPGGESPRDVLRRVRSWLVGVAAADLPVIAVTHLGVMRAVLAAATGWDMSAKPPIRLLGDTLHRFAVDRAGTVSIVECNVPLVPETRVEAL
jgi:hypothetical protein